jgi:predicted MFS family arabinose efflux permease
LNRTIVLLAFAAFASSASMRVTDALLPRLAREFDVGLASVSWVITGFAVAYGVMQVLFGPLGDRIGKLRMIAIGCGGAAAANAACYLVPGFEGLLGARIAAGGFVACVIPLAMAWIGDEVPYEERQPVIARFLIGQIMGVAVGAAVGGYAAESAQWRWPFMVLALWLALSCAAIALRSRGEVRPPPGSRRFFRDMAGVLENPWARVVVVTVFVEGVLVFGALAFVPTHLHFVRGMEMSRAGLMLLPYGLGGVAFALVVRHVMRRLGEPGLAVAGALLLAAGFLVIALAPWAPLAPLACLVAGFGFYTMHNTLQTNATQMAPQRRGAGMALFASSFFIGQSVGVALAGAMAQAAGTTPLIAVAGVLLVPLGYVLARRLRHRRAMEGDG